MIPLDQIKAKNVANILTKLKEGKVLTEREHRTLAEYQEEQAANSHLDKVWENGIPNAILCEHWGVVKSYLSKLRKTKDMPPFRTLREADLWRAQNAPPAPQRQNAALQTRAEPANPPPHHAPGQPPPPADFPEDLHLDDTTDFDELMLRQAEGAVKMAWWLLQEAVRRRDHAGVAYANKNWSEAAKQAAAVRERFLAIQQKTGELLPLDLVLDTVGTTLGGIRSGLARLPSRTARLANPEDPNHAAAIIEKEVDRILQLSAPALDRVARELTKKTASRTATTSNESETTETP